MWCMVTVCHLLSLCEGLKCWKRGKHVRARYKCTRNKLRSQQRRDKNRDVWLSRHPRGRTCNNNTFNPSLPRKKKHAGVRLLTWGENPPTRICKRGRGVNKRNDLHVWLNRCADGLTRRYCDAYKAPYRLNYPFLKLLSDLTAMRMRIRTRRFIYIRTIRRGTDMKNTRGDVRRCRSWTPYIIPT